MDFINPSNDTYTVYTKSGCPNCVKAKKMLTDLKFNPLIIDCDDYLIEHREEFLATIKKLVNGNDNKVFLFLFPIIFNNGKYIGGYKDIENLLFTLYV